MTRERETPGKKRAPSRRRIVVAGALADEVSAGESAVRAAARRGAKSASTRRQVIEDAAEHAVQRWVDRVLRGKENVGTIETWAFRVGANASKRIGRRTARDSAREEESGPSCDSQAWKAWKGGPDGRAVWVRDRKVLLAEVRRQKEKLTRKQLLVALKLCEPGMSLHRAAAVLGMDRSTLKRTFQRTLGALLGR